MTNFLQEKTTLNNGIEMPFIGLGIRELLGSQAIKSIAYALEAGYRSIDTSPTYLNEPIVRKGIAAANVSREDLFITGKLWTTVQSEKAFEKAFDKTRKRLDMDYLDLYLLNTPTQNHLIAWPFMINLYEKGLVKAIGVSNYNVRHLETLRAFSDVIPAVNQVEFHPYQTQENLLKYCKENAIQLEAWAPLSRGEILANKIIIDLATKYEKTPAQIVLRWHFQNGVVAIPKSYRFSRIESNAALSDFSLSEEDMVTINQLNQNKHWMGSYGL